MSGGMFSVYSRCLLSLLCSRAFFFFLYSAPRSIALVTTIPMESEEVMYFVQFIHQERPRHRIVLLRSLGNHDHLPFHHRYLLENSRFSINVLETSSIALVSLILNSFCGWISFSFYLASTGRSFFTTLEKDWSSRPDWVTVLLGFQMCSRDFAGTAWSWGAAGFFSPSRISLLLPHLMVLWTTTGGSQITLHPFLLTAQGNWLAVSYWTNGQFLLVFSFFFMCGVSWYLASRCLAIIAQCWWK